MKHTLIIRRVKKKKMNPKIIMFPTNSLEMTHRVTWFTGDDFFFFFWRFHRYTFDGPDLIISNVEPSDEGVYTCQVITKMDMAEASGTLTLCGKITAVPGRTVLSLFHFLTSLNGGENKYVCCCPAQIVQILLSCSKSLTLDIALSHWTGLLETTITVLSQVQWILAHFWLDIVLAIY